MNWLDAPDICVQSFSSMHADYLVDACRASCQRSQWSPWRHCSVFHSLVRSFLLGAPDQSYMKGLKIIRNRVSTITQNFVFEILALLKIHPSLKQSPGSILGAPVNIEKKMNPSGLSSDEIWSHPSPKNNPNTTSITVPALPVIRRPRRVRAQKKPDLTNGTWSANI